MADSAVQIDSPTSKISLRAPNTASGATETSSSFTPPPIPWMEGTWHVTHSTLPMWRKARNVAITYKSLPSNTPDGPLRLDDTVSYQSLSSDKVKTVSGIDTPADGLGAWHWRGKGWLIIASSHWQVLGYGGGEGEDQWVVTYFAKTMFTPAGIDFYSRKKGGCSNEIFTGMKEALECVEADDVKALVGQLFEVKSD